MITRHSDLFVGGPYDGKRPDGADPMDTLSRLIDGYRPNTKTPPG